MWKTIKDRERNLTEQEQTVNRSKDKKTNIK